MSEKPPKGPADEFASRRDRVQCPNCCQFAPVTSRGMGLLFYRCELCGATGAASSDEVIETPAGGSDTA